MCGLYFIGKYFEYFSKRVRYLFVNNKRYREKRFVNDFGRAPDMSEPRTFNEKIMYRMLEKNKSLQLTKMADKYQARKLVSQMVGEEYLVPLLKVYNSVNDIDFAKLPERFVLKCTHDSGSVVICKDKQSFDEKYAKSKLRFCMKRNMYYTTREWQYKDIPPRILCEEYVDLSVESNAGFYPEIYRVHCFEGCPVWIEVEYVDIRGARYSEIYDPEWTPQPLLMGYPNPGVKMRAPYRLGELLSLSSRLTSGLDYCRADFYMTRHKLYFSEFTFSPSNGREVFTPDVWDLKFGEQWVLNPK